MNFHHTINYSLPDSNISRITEEVLQDVCWQKSIRSILKIIALRPALNFSGPALVLYGISSEFLMFIVSDYKDLCDKYPQEHCQRIYCCVCHCYLSLIKCVVHK